MRSRLTKVASALTLVAALAVGGATFASASSKAPSKAPPAVLKAPASAGDGDSIQQGDQSAPDVPGATEGSSESSSESSSEPAGESGSEVPGNDGPGGHADEPGNPNADHQFDGAE
jgi:hypothetical protein